MSDDHEGISHAVDSVVHTGDNPDGGAMVVDEPPEVMLDDGTVEQGSHLVGMSRRFTKIFAPTYEINFIKTANTGVVLVKIEREDGGYIFDRITIDGMSEKEIVNLINIKINTADAVEARERREREARDG